MQKGYASGKKTKEKIIKAALELFAEKGYEGTSTREIAALAGQKLFSISYHFGSKEQLYASVIDYIVGSIKSTNVVMANHDVSMDMGFAQLITIVTNMVNGSLSAEAVPNGRIILQEQYSPTVNFSKLTKNILEPIQNSIGQALANAVGRPDLADSREFMLHSHLIHSLVLSYRVFKQTLESRMNITNITNEDKQELVNAVVFQVECIVTGLRQRYNTAVK